MMPTPHPDVNAIIAATLEAIRAELGRKLVGLAVFGSLVTGAYEPGISDVDLVAALTEDLDVAEGERLARMHARIAAARPAWADRLEVGYLSLETLAAFTAGRPMGRMSPGEPFHLTEAGTDWLFNLALLRERGVAVWGPDPGELVGAIAPGELRAALRDLMAGWTAWIGQTDNIHLLPYQSYMVLTMCRALVMARTGVSGSKLEAAAWAERELPEWGPLIRDAVVWRREAAHGDPPSVDPARTLPEVLRFVHLVIDAVLAG